MAGRREQSGVTEEALSIEVAGRPVPAILWRPERAVERTPLVLAGHGCGERVGAEQEQTRRRQMSVEEAVKSLWTVELVEEMTGDWQGTIDYLIANRGLGKSGVGYWGLSGGTTFGLPLVASEPRITAAILGLNGAVPLMLAYADRVTCPVLYMMNLEDRFMTRDSSLALFDALASTDKRVVGLQGDHGQNMDKALPDWVRFLADRLE